MNDYEAKRETRIERLHERAVRKRAEGAGRLAAERRILGVIPLGQPILVGHHSEGRHRRDLARADAHCRAGMAALKEAADLEGRAYAAEQSTAVSSDDPEAVTKLRAKLADIEQRRERSKAVNRAVRAKDPRTALAALGVGPAMIEEFLTPDFCGRLGVPAYRLQNLSAEARRVKARIAELEAQAVAPPREPLVFGNVRIEEADNRCRIYFPAKPAESVRAELKAAGFHWSPSEGAWQRMAGNQAWWLAEQIARTASSVESVRGPHLPPAPPDMPDEHAAGVAYWRERGIEPGGQVVRGASALLGWGVPSTPGTACVGARGAYVRSPYRAGELSPNGWTRAACTCHRGSTCDVSHDPAVCSCAQCVTAEARP